ncbi:MAG TPA: hypothetical protein VL992_10750, partial [Tepidisphaeraceae bacterium]|nr:hypothetical protein [Tepidisphaeraceae bacterium]
MRVLSCHKKRHIHPIIVIALFIIAGGAPFPVLADPDVTLTPRVNSPGHEISPDFCGLSFEMSMLHPSNGKYFFSPEHAELISLFKSLGVRSLRVGGNSADSPEVALPTEDEIDRL